ncbi:MCE family protein [Millisia brevis]|uniref:MCE family protein n=1 Tax=Millisia brevis TaxID=264148 RepID=UPI000834ACF3|nr:MCE family protein [Millisia brevis]
MAAVSGLGRTVVLGLVALLVVIAAAGVGWWAFTRLGTKDLYAYFDKTVGLYSGSDVRMLGVPVGSVTSVEPEGDRVRVDMRIDRGIKVPADTQAYQITPSVVSDRYVQLDVYRDGPEISSGTEIEHTHVPVEVDQLYASVSELAEALGPNGANANGALSDLVEVGAQNLDGNGEALGSAITELTAAVDAINNSRGDLYGTIDNLSRFVDALAAGDQQVRAFNTQLASLSGFLVGERESFNAAIQQLSVTLADLAEFVRNNRDVVADNANALAPVSQTLMDGRQNLIDAVTLLPLAINNVVNSYDSDSGTLTSRLNFNELQDPKQLFCNIMDLSNLRPGDPQFEALGRQMAPLVDNCGMLLDQVVTENHPPDMVLPFGILSADEIQRYVVPGTVPGTPSDRLGGSTVFDYLVNSGGGTR